MGLVALLDRLAGRFNRWFGPAAVAANVQGPGAPGEPPAIDPARVKVLLGELERSGADDDRDESSPRRTGRE